MTQADDMEESGGGIGKTQWALITASAVAALALGHVAARASGFPLYPGWQGVLIQQHWLTRVAAVAAMVVAVAVSARVAGVLTGWAEGRLAAALSLLSLAAYSARGGTMGSVMQAADGREVFWFLAGELAVMSLVAWGAFRAGRWLTGLDEPACEAPSRGVIMRSIAVQALGTVALILVLGQSYDKPQAMMTVLLACMAGAALSKSLTGYVWRSSWCVPLLAGVAGYIVNAVTSSGVEIANIQSMAAGMAMPLPLDYVALGPIGAILGEMLAEHSGDAMQPAAEGTGE